MAEPPSAFDALKTELEGFDLEQAIDWLRQRVLKDAEHRLSGRDHSASDGLSMRWNHLTKPLRDLVGSALTRVLEGFLAEGNLPRDAALELLYLCRDVQPPAVGTLLQNLLAPFLDTTKVTERARFDALDPAIQATIMEVLSSWHPPLDQAFWLRLAERDPRRFALRAFFALAPYHGPEAAEALARVPAEPDQLKRLAFAAEWLKSVVPLNSKWLQYLADGPAELDVKVATAFREALERADVELPAQTLFRCDPKALHTLMGNQRVSRSAPQPFASCTA